MTATSEPRVPDARAIAERLGTRGDTVAVAESSTGGLISAALLAVPGASAYFIGGAVIYTGTAREGVLGIPADDLRGMRPLSEAMVGAFAERIRQQCGATWGIAELGATGPAGSRYGHPAGVSMIVVTGPVTLARFVETGSDDRGANMTRFATEALALLDAAIGAAG